MRSPSLTRSSRKVNGRLVSDYEWRGNTVGVCDSAQNALLVIELFEDEQLTPSEKAGLLVNMLFPEPAPVMVLAGDDMGDLLATVVWEAFGLDVSEDHRYADGYESPVFDWKEDAARIRASLLQAYGIDWAESSDNMPYVDMCALLGTLLEAESDTPFQQAVIYRTAEPPKRTKYNEAECQAFDARADYFALGGGKDNAQAQNDAMDDAFAAMMRAAKGV